MGLRGPDNRNSLAEHRARAVRPVWGRDHRERKDRDAEATPGQFGPGPPDVDKHAPASKRQQRPALRDQPEVLRDHATPGPPDRGEQAHPHRRGLAHHQAGPSPRYPACPAHRPGPKYWRAPGAERDGAPPGRRVGTEQCNARGLCSSFRRRCREKGPGKSWNSCRRESEAGDNTRACQMSPVRDEEFTLFAVLLPMFHGPE